MALSQNSSPPRHIAIIMDGNGRWAKQRGLPRTAGHAAGAEAFRRIANYCRTLGVEYLTVYAFSTENWKRSAEEVAGIMKLLRRYLEEALRDMEKNRVKFRFFGDLTRLSPELQTLCHDAESRSEDYDVQVNFCLNYGGRDEIIHAVKAYTADVAAGKADPEELTEDVFSRYLYSAGVPDPELIIRPSGEMRVSNFLLWQSAYSEYVIMNVLWPDFTPEHLDSAIEEFHRRSRRFGGTLRNEKTHYFRSDSGADPLSSDTGRTGDCRVTGHECAHGHRGLRASVPHRACKAAAAGDLLLHHGGRRVHVELFRRDSFLLCHPHDCVLYPDVLGDDA